MDGSWRVQAQYRFDLPCPPPGKHLVQARYKLSGLWSEISPAIHFDSARRNGRRSFPSPRTISPAQSRHGIVSLSAGPIGLQLAHVRPHDRIEVALEGKKCGEARFAGNCTWKACLSNRVPPGTYALTVRAIPCDSDTGLSSEPSEAILRSVV